MTKQERIQKLRLLRADMIRLMADESGTYLLPPWRHGNADQLFHEIEYLIDNLEEWLHNESH